MILKNNKQGLEATKARWRYLPKVSDDLEELEHTLGEQSLVFLIDYIVTYAIYTRCYGAFTALLILNLSSLRRLEIHGNELQSLEVIFEVLYQLTKSLVNLIEVKDSNIPKAIQRDNLQEFTLLHPLELPVPLNLLFLPL
jgi:hypothetical protein